MSSQNLNGHTKDKRGPAVHNNNYETPIQSQAPNCTMNPSQEQERTELLLSGFTVDEQTLANAHRFISGMISWRDFLMESHFDNLPASAWDEWTR
jgi:hypothetical protein